MNVLIFPTILIVLDIGAGIMYGYAGDWRMTVYWLSASALTFVVTY